MASILQYCYSTYQNKSKNLKGGETGGGAKGIVQNIKVKKLIIKR